MKKESRVIAEFYKNTVKKLLESCAKDKINAMNCFGQTVIDKVTVDQAKKSNLQVCLKIDIGKYGIFSFIARKWK